MGSTYRNGADAKKVGGTCPRPVLSQQLPSSSVRLQQGAPEQIGN